MKYLFPLLLCTCLHADVEQDSIRNQARRWALEAPPTYSCKEEKEEPSFSIKSMEELNKRDANPHKISSKVSNYDTVKKEHPPKK